MGSKILSTLTMVIGLIFLLALTATIQATGAKDVSRESSGPVLADREINSSRVSHASTILSHTAEITFTSVCTISLPGVWKNRSPLTGMILIPGGPFTMGSDNGDPEDTPAHEADLPAFEIDRFEVTNAEFAAFVETTGYETDAEKAGKRSWRDSFVEGKDNHPVVRVSWNDAVVYCQWFGKRLPTEAEWEKAARGTDERIHPWGNEWDPSKANVKETGLRGTAAVGSFGAGASPYGVEDMVGNVWEWTADWYQAYPGNTAGDAYYGEICRVIRGGGWFDNEPQATTFNRNCADPDRTAIDELGFRCAKDAG
jgi:formylglycine-generating enzyme required for sulfatase activity